MLSFSAALDGAEEPLEEPDAFVWLLEQWWTSWVALVVFCIVGLWMVRSMVLHRGRERQVKQAALANGMTYRGQDGYGLDQVKFAHMARGTGRGWGASHVVTLTGHDGAKVHAFDVRSWVEVVVNQNTNGEKMVRRHRIGHSRASDRIVRKYVGATQTAAMAPLPINAPRLVIGRENLLSKAFATATRLDLDVESEFFNRNYHVVGEDRSFATAILDAQMIDLMVSTEGKITFEFFGTWLLLHTEQIEPELLPALARLADEMRGVVPQLAIDRWSRTSVS